MFQITTEDIDYDELRLQMRADDCGGFVSFEGWVRNHHEGRAVEQLEYEIYPELAITEGNKIIEEAKEKFQLDNALCVHRGGLLSIGGIAVWVGVSTPHRGEAFEACRYIIDQVKHRVPIWKKEYYIEGDSGWVRCERCAQHSKELDHVNHENKHVQTH